MIITAKFASTCPTCMQRIEAGSKVEWSRGNAAQHQACAGKPLHPGAAPQQNNAPRTRRYERRGYGGPLPGGRWPQGHPSYYSSGQYDDES